MHVAPPVLPGQTICSQHVLDLQWRTMVLLPGAAEDRVPFGGHPFLVVTKARFVVATTSSSRSSPPLGQMWAWACLQGLPKTEQKSIGETGEAKG